jgi:hypothetical protein
MLGDLINADDERLLALGQRVASALPPLDQWEARLRTAHAYTMRLASFSAPRMLR